MDTLYRNQARPAQNALAPTPISPMGPPPVRGGVPKGVWVGGGLMALTIIALATALVVKSGGSSAPAASAVPATTAATPATATPAPTAPATPAAATPAPAPAAQHAAARHPVPHHHTAARTPEAGGQAGTVAANNGTGTGAAPAEPTRASPPPVCHTCGTIEGYDAVKVQGQTNGVGVVSGGALGAVLGSKIAGRNNHTLGGVLGAIGGGLLGNQIEKSQRTVTMYDVHVRMDDGTVRTIRESHVPSVGERVTVEGNTMRARPAGSSSDAGTSTPGNASSFSPNGN